MPLTSMNKAAHSGFETQRTRKQKSKNSGPKNGHVSTKVFLLPTNKV